MPYKAGFLRISNKKTNMYKPKYVLIFMIYWYTWYTSIKRGDAFYSQVR